MVIHFAILMNQDILFFSYHDSNTPKPWVDSRSNVARILSQHPAKPKTAKRHWAENTRPQLLPHARLLVYLNGFFILELYSPW